MHTLLKLCFVIPILSSSMALSTFALSVEHAAALQNQAQTWQKVESNKVCMVTDMVFPRDQIPVQVGKKTYYGCCANCKTRLGEDEKMRFAIDPITERKVDKATASIAAGPDGSVVYFENDTSLEKFIAFRTKAEGPIN